jgi:hypothetical protein
MSYAKVDEIIRRTVEELIAVGASRETIELHVESLELAAVNSIAENKRNQMLLDLRYRTADLAKAWDMCERTVRNKRKAAIERQYDSATGSNKAA